MQLIISFLERVYITELLLAIPDNLVIVLRSFTESGQEGDVVK